MTPGLYVVRQTAHTLKLESRLLGQPTDEGDVLRARSWREWIQSQHPRDRAYLVCVLDHEAEFTVPAAVAAPPHDPLLLGEPE